jgi:hypothetical protein
MACAGAIDELYKAFNTFMVEMNKSTGWLNDELMTTISPATSWTP